MGSLQAQGPSLPCRPGGTVRSQVQKGVFGSPPVTLRGLMRNDVLMLNGGGGQVHGRFMVAGINSAWRRLHGGLALIRCYEVFRSLHGLEIHLNGS